MHTQTFPLTRIDGYTNDSMLCASCDMYLNRLKTIDDTNLSFSLRPAVLARTKRSTPLAIRNDCDDNIVVIAADVNDDNEIRKREENENYYVGCLESEHIWYLFVYLLQWQRP